MYLVQKTFGYDQSLSVTDPISNRAKESSQPEYIQKAAVFLPGDKTLPCRSDRKERRKCHTVLPSNMTSAEFQLQTALVI